MMDLGTYTDHEGRPAVRFERTYPHPVERVWSAISEPAELAAWFPSGVRIEPREGGMVEFSDDPNTAPSVGKVIAYEPPRRLAFTWGDDELHLWLEPREDGCTLTLVDVLEARDTAARSAAGWTVCLVELDRHVSGERTGGPHADTAEPWRPLYDRYVANGVPYGAAIPGQSESTA